MSLTGKQKNALGNLFAALLFCSFIAFVVCSAVYLK